MREVIKTYRIRVIGLVQGVGFRPFIVRLAKQFQLEGTVDNRNDGVLIETNFTEVSLAEFKEQILQQAPRASVIEKIESKEIAPKVFDDFLIVRSSNNNIHDEITEVSPDIAVCESCLEDIKRQALRKNYPLTNCTHCGPRFSIIRDLPYDRPKTTMADFLLCPDCLKEYEDIEDRRFHAQPVACNRCGPHYILQTHDFQTKCIEEVIAETVSALERGESIALKGIGGYNLMCDASSEEAVQHLRKSKHRDGKPVAVMFRNMDVLEKYAHISDKEKENLESWRRPIVLVAVKKELAPSVCKGFSRIGVLLPYMPFHHMLFEKCKLDALVLTSANLAGEPIIIDDQQAQQAFKGHTVISYNRAIHNRVDDSVSLVMNKQLRLIRRSRGFVPSPIRTAINVDGILAVGAELVNTFCIGRTKQAILSQHIGDLKNPETLDFFEESIARYQQLYKFKPQCIVSDLHPEYMSTKYAENQDVQLVKVQHHHAHMASCMMENGLNEKVIAVVMDGTGLGTDGTIWGGEYLLGDLSDFERKAHFKSISLPGGDKVTSEPWRTAISYLYSAFGEVFMDLEIPFVQQLDKQKASFVSQMIDKNINCPKSSSAGRLFDAVSAILNICSVADFHAEAPMRLEDAIDGLESEAFYPFEIIEGTVDFDKMIRSIVEDLQQGLSIANIATKFHNTIIEVSTTICCRIRSENDIHKIVLSGGSFQNLYLSEKLEQRLSESNFEVFVHKRVPANDGGISLGQLGIAAALRKTHNL